MISNIYFNQDKSGVQRIGTKRGNGPLSHINLEEGEEIIGVYGNYSESEDYSVISSLGFIVWKPAAWKYDWKAVKGAFRIVMITFIYQRKKEFQEKGKLKFSLLWENKFIEI